MPLLIRLEDEFGNNKDEFSDRGILYGLIEASADRSEAGKLRLIDYIDPYGNTVFNIFQCERVKSEIDGLRGFANTESELEFLDRFAELLKECQKRVHHYIKIYGD